MPTVTIHSFADMLATGHKLTAFCSNVDCRHCAELDLVALAERFGAEHGGLLADIGWRLRCSACGKRGCSLILAPDLAPHNGYPG